MSVVKWKCIVLSLFLLSSANLKISRADTTLAVEISLIEAIELISKAYDVYFTFDMELVKDIKVNYEPKHVKSLEEAMSNLLRETHLNYKLLDKQFLIIYKNDEAGLTSLKSMSEHLDKLIKDEESAFHRKKKNSLHTGSNFLPFEQAPVRGSVVNPLGAPLVGVSVKVRGTTIGTVTDTNGRFVLDGVGVDDVLVFTYIGYLSQEAPAAYNTDISITLSEDLQALNEVVVVGYGVQEKINLTGAVGVISNTQLENRAVGSVLEAMQGQVSGLNIVRTTGQPGNQSFSFNIRGSSTFTDNPVLTIVDGVPSSLDYINPNDIESISVLKDAASAAIYGSRATGGVIIVTTKTGRSGAPRLQYNSTFSLQEPSRWPEKPSAYDYALIHNTAAANDGTAPRFSPSDLEKFSSPDWKDHDWDDYLLNNAFQTNQNISLSGGSETHDYYLSMGYLKQDGIIGNSGYERLNVQLNQNTRIGKMVTLSAKAGYSPSTRTAPAYGWDQLRFIYSTPKTEPFMSDDGKWLNESTHTLQGNAMAGLSEDGGQQILKRNRLTGNVSAKFALLEGLDVTASYGIVSTNSRQRTFRNILTVYDPVNPALVSKRSIDNFLDINNSRDILQNVNLLANYRKSFDDHTISILGGVTREWYEDGNEFVGTRDFLTENIFVISAGSSNPDYWNISGVASDWALESYISRLNYSFKDRYLLEGTFRYDGSSRFTTDRRWGFFPSVSAGWIASEEDFLQNQDVITFLKLRGSWGQVGNQNVGFYPFANRLSQSAYYFNGLPNRTVRTVGAPNPLLTWETKESINVGLEGSIFGHLLDFSIDYFNEKTHDILLLLPLPTTYGQSAPVQNAGRVDNKGWELDLRHRNTIGSLTYGISFQVSNNTNKVVDMGGVSPRIANNTITEEGRPMNEWYGYRAEGFFQSQDEVDSHAFQSPDTAPGDIRYYDANNDNVINSDDRVRLGISSPRLPYGIRLNLKYHHFDLTAFGQGVMEHMVVTRPWEANTYRSYHLDYWTPEHRSAAFPAPRIGGGPLVGINKEFSSFWIEDAAYFRLKHIELGYALPPSVLTRIKMSYVRFFVSAENLFTLTNYLGYDPEAATGLDIRQVESRYPLSKMFNLGVNVNF